MHTPLLLAAVAVLAGCGGADPPIDEIKASGVVVCACDTKACADEEWAPLAEIAMKWGDPAIQAKWDAQTAKAYEDAFAAPQECKRALMVKELGG